ncbi:MAG: FAD/NAD(P)-binding protein, partial [Myxococcota bacterium]
LRWLIIGGGPQGVHIAAALQAGASVAPNELRIVDPGDSLLEVWNQRAATVGMSHLRSPAVHHVDADPWSLHRFAESWTPDDAVSPFAGPYARPSTTLFAAHASAVIEARGLDALHVRASATALRPMSGALGWTVELDDGEALTARRVVLALGSGGTQRIPAWARPHLEDPAAWVQHVFDPGFDLDARRHFRRVAIIGGGISAAQLAVRLAGQGRMVSVVSPHRLRRAQFDSDSQWLGPAKMRAFSKERDMARRRAMIEGARRPGTMTKEVHRALRAQVAKGRVRLVEDTVRGVFALPNARVLGLRRPLEVDAVVLATGFEGQPGAPFLAGLCPEQFPRARCGTPCVDAHLEWGHGLHVAGALAELQLGPVARNIAGGRRAAERLVPLAIAERDVTRRAPACPRAAG